MTLNGFGRFDLAYFRHTERWFTVYRGLTAAECFEEIESNEVFWPMWRATPRRGRLTGAWPAFIRQSSASTRNEC